jgi:hypothetical protein
MPARLRLYRYTATFGCRFSGGSDYPGAGTRTVQFRAPSKARAHRLADRVAKVENGKRPRPLHWSLLGVRRA